MLLEKTIQPCLCWRESLTIPKSSGPDNAARWRIYMSSEHQSRRQPVFRPSRQRRACWCVAEVEGAQSTSKNHGDSVPRVRSLIKTKIKNAGILVRFHHRLLTLSKRVAFHVNTKRTSCVCSVFGKRPVDFFKCIRPNISNSLGYEVFIQH